MKSKVKDKLVGIYAPAHYDHISMLEQTQEFSEWFSNNHKDVDLISNKLGISTNKLNRILTLDQLPDEKLLKEMVELFLLFNMLIRGMNGIVVHGDALSREIKNVYFIQNTSDDYMKFSDLNVMPRSEMAEKVFNVHKWIGDGIEHIESPFIDWRN